MTSSALTKKKPIKGSVSVIKLPAGEAYTIKKAATESRKSIQYKPLDFLLAVSIPVIKFEQI